VISTLLCPAASRTSASVRLPARAWLKLVAVAASLLHPDGWCADVEATVRGELLPRGGQNVFTCGALKMLQDIE